MKTKVLKYKFDGNTVVAPYIELEPYAENVYVSLSKKNEYGNESEDYFHVVCKINNVYFSCGQSSRRDLDKEKSREEAAANCRNWIANTLENAKNGGYVSQLAIRVFNALGLDPAPLEKAREAYAKRQEQRRMEWKRKEEEKRKLEAEQWQRQLDDAKRKFLAGEKITAELFLEIAKRDGFDIHIRTKGTFNKHVIGINRNGTVSYRKYRGCRTPDFTGCHKAVAGYLAFIIGNEVRK